jgi:hypothetical protein
MLFSIGATEDADPAPSQRPPEAMDGIAGAGV